jgi:histidinol-phosphate aminotransferase
VKKSPVLQGVKDQVLRAPVYSLRTYDAPIKINQNENPYDYPDDLKEKVLSRFRSRRWSRYPEFVPDTLRVALAGFSGWKKDGILVGNGSNELLLSTLMVLLRERTSVVLPVPTFTVYSLVSQILGARLVPVMLRDDMSYDVDSILARADESAAKAIILCSPNNPTGTVLPKEGLRRILESFHGYVLLDEAYFEFCGCTGMEFLEQFPKLVITRTFSKAMGMAGLRVGYLMAHPELAAQIAKAKLPYNVNQFSLTAAEVALENLARFEPAIEAILRERKRLKAELDQVPGVRTFPTGANFFLLELDVSPRPVFEDMYGQGVLVRDVSSYPMLSRCLRVTVGKPEENDRFLSAFRAALERARTAGASADM